MYERDFLTSYTGLLQICLQLLTLGLRINFKFSFCKLGFAQLKQDDVDLRKVENCVIEVMLELATRKGLVLTGDVEKTVPQFITGKNPKISNSFFGLKNSDRILKKTEKFKNNVLQK